MKHLFIQPFHARSQAMLFEMFIYKSNIIHVVLQLVLLLEYCAWNIEPTSRYKAILLQTLSITQDIPLVQVLYAVQWPYWSKSKNVTESQITLRIHAMQSSMLLAMTPLKRPWCELMSLSQKVRCSNGSVRHWKDKAQCNHLHTLRARPDAASSKDATDGPSLVLCALEHFQVYCPEIIYNSDFMQFF